MLQPIADIAQKEDRKLAGGTWESLYSFSTLERKQIIVTEMAIERFPAEREYRIE